MPNARDRSRSPLGEVRMLLRMQDTIYELQNKVVQQEGLIRDKNETIEELKLQILELRELERRRSA